MPFIEAMMLNFFLLFHSNLDRYGLFSQTSASDSNLIPSNSAKLLDNDIDMIDFSWSVGKALYEGICWTIHSHQYLCRNFWGAIVF
jgi:hypothetical protein